MVTPIRRYDPRASASAWDLVHGLKMVHDAIYELTTAEEDVELKGMERLFTFKCGKFLARRVTKSVLKEAAS